MLDLVFGPFALSSDTHRAASCPWKGGEGLLDASSMTSERRHATVEALGRIHKPSVAPGGARSGFLSLCPVVVSMLARQLVV